MPIIAQKVNTDSIKAQMDKIEVTNQGMKQVIENYKKGVIKGDLEAMNSLAQECITGKYVKPDIEMGLMKSCRPPIWATSSAPGLMDRW